MHNAHGAVERYSISISYYVQPIQGELPPMSIKMHHLLWKPIYLMHSKKSQKLIDLNLTVPEVHLMKLGLKTRLYGTNAGKGEVSPLAKTWQGILYFVFTSWQGCLFEPGEDSPSHS